MTGGTTGPEDILRVGLGFWASKTLLSAVEIEVFTELAKRSGTVDELQGRLGLHVRAARDFLDALVALGFLQRHDGVQSAAGVAAGIFEKPVSGATPERVFLEREPGVSHTPKDWSRDGRTVVFSKLRPDNQLWNLWVLPLSGDRKPFPYRAGAFSENEAAISPNGRWLAFVSNESGQDEVIVQPFPDPSGGRWQISTDGGLFPRWRRDGREIYYFDSIGQIVAVSVLTEPGFEVQHSRALFQTALQPATEGSLFPYDVTSDGQRFLLAVPLATTDATPIKVFLNWMSLRQQ